MAEVDADGKPAHGRRGIVDPASKSLGTVGTSFTSTGRPEVKVARQRVFLQTLAATGLIGQACVAAGVSREAAKYWRTAAKGADEFQKKYEAALADYAERLEAEAYRRGVVGVQEPQVYQGQIQYLMDPMKPGEYMLDGDSKPIPVTITKYSDRLLEVMLKARAGMSEHRKGGGTVNVNVGEGSGMCGSNIQVVFVESDGAGNVRPVGQMRPGEAEMSPVIDVECEDLGLDDTPDEAHPYADGGVTDIDFEELPPDPYPDLDLGGEDEDDDDLGL